MNKIINSLIIPILLVFILCVFSGTVIWILYPHIHALFPNAAENNLIAKELGWWDSVCITWIFSILFKSSISKENKK